MSELTVCVGRSDQSQCAVSSW